MAASCLPRGEIGPATDASVATGRNGSANTDQRLSPRRIDGESGRLHFARAIIDGGNIPHVIGGVGMVMALVTILYGFLMYLPQQDMKRLLARSTITQLGWMFFGLSLSIFGSRLALEGSIAYIVNHAFAKSLFFLVAGALSYSCGTRLLPRLRGVLHTLPLPGVGFCVAALAITGVPPFNGFFSKFPLFAAGFALSVEYWILLPAMILLMIESVASFAWFIRWFGRVVPGKPSEAVADAAPLPVNAPGADCTDCDVADFQRNRRDPGCSKEMMNDRFYDRK